MPTPGYPHTLPDVRESGCFEVKTLGSLIDRAFESAGALDALPGPELWTCDVTRGEVSLPLAWARALGIAAGPNRWHQVLRPLATGFRRPLLVALKAWRDGHGPLDVKLPFGHGHEERWARVTCPTLQTQTAIGMIEDVTWRRAELATLQQSERELQQAFDAATDGMAWVSSEGVVLKANLSELALLHCAPDDYLGHRRREFHADPQAFDDVLARAHHGPVRDVPMTLKRRDGGEVHVQLDAAMAWRQGAGHIFQLQSRDVTRARAAEEALRASHLHLQLTLESARMGTFEIDPERGLVQGNERTAALVGDPQIVHGMPVARAIEVLCHPLDRGRVQESLGNALGDSGALDIELRIVTPTGETRWLSVHGRLLLDGSGQSHRMIGVLIDTTDRRTEDARLLAALEALQRQVGQNLHDDVGQVLTGLAFSTRSLHSDAPPGLRPRLERLVELTNLATQKVRDVSRGLLPPSVEHLSLHEALQDLCETSQHLLGIEVSQELTADEPLTSPDERVHLTLLAREALSNAARHAKAKQVRVRLGHVGERWTLEVSDDGSGLVPGARHGHGLGLRIMEYRARALGGSFELDSSTPRGLTVRCVFWRPLAPPPSRPSLKEAP